MSDHKRRRATRPHRTGRRINSQRGSSAAWTRPRGSVTVADQWQTFMISGVWVPAPVHAKINHRNQRQRRLARRRGQR